MMLFVTVTMQFVLRAANRDRAVILAAEAEAEAERAAEGEIAAKIIGDDAEGAALAK
jgi:hypothetical protein